MARVLRVVSGRLRLESGIFLGIAVALMFAGACESSVPGGSRTQPPGAAPAIRDNTNSAGDNTHSPGAAPLREADTVCTIGTTVLTVADAMYYLDRYPNATVDEFIHRELAIHDVLQRGIQNGVPAKKQMRQIRLALLGEDYLDEGLDSRISITGDEIAADLTGSSKIGNFELLLFDSMEEARKTAETVRTGKDFREIAGKRPDKVKKTGEIFPSSGFFQPYDDLGLFNMKPGDVTGLIETGLGIAIVRVDTMRELTPKEVTENVLRIKDKLRAAKKEVLAKEMQRKHRYARRDDVIEKMARKELENDWSIGEDPVIGSVDTIEVTFQNLKNLMTTDPKKSKKDITVEELAELYRRTLQSFLYTIAIGLEADREGHQIRSDKRRTELEERNRRYLFTLGVIDRLGKDAAPPNDKVAKAFFDENKEKFRSQEMVRLAFVFTTEEAKAKEALKEYRGGADFGAVARKYSEKKGPAVQDGREVYLLRSHLYVKEYPDLQKLFTPEYRKAGTVSPVLRGPEGFYVFKILEHVPEGSRKFSDVKSGIKKALWTRTVETAMATYYADLKTRYSPKSNDGVIAKLRSRERSGKAGHGGSPHSGSPHGNLPR